jgi:hypothetical protein
MAFSTKDYSWSDVSVVVGGRLLEGVTEFEYTAKQDKEIKRGRGNKGHGIMRGDKAYEGKLVVWQSELEAMIRDAPGNDILNLNFSITVAYTPLDGGQNVIDIVPEAEFLEYKKGMKTGDKQMLVELPVIFYDLKPQQ